MRRYLLAKPLCLCVTNDRVIHSSAGVIRQESWGAYSGNHPVATIRSKVPEHRTAAHASLVYYSKETFLDPNHLPVDDSSPYHDVLAQCVDHWALIPERTLPLRDGVNHVFSSESKRGDPIIIRISDGTLRTRSELLGELIWLEHLIQHGCTVTTPIPSREGGLLESFGHDSGTMHVCCFERFGGRELHPATDPEWNDELFLQLGQAIGRIHRVSDELKLPTDQDRQPWYAGELMRFPDPLTTGFNPRVVEAMRNFLQQLRCRPTNSREYGLVHRDLHSGNFLFENGQVEIIDFDLGCYGWRTMDFAVLLFSHYFYPSLRVPQSSQQLIGHVLAQLVAGYRTEYHVDDEQLATVGDMILLHTILNYIVMVPAIDHWQTALGNPSPTVTESLAWLESLWLGEQSLEIDLSQV